MLHLRAHTFIAREDGDIVPENRSAQLGLH
jgi:hypothetical protein